MTQYLYQDVDTGEQFTLERPMSEAPGLDLKMEGRTLKRVYGAPAIINESHSNGHLKYPDGSPIGSRGLGRDWPFAEHYDKKRRPLFANKRERREAEARAQHAGDLLTSADLSQPGNPEKGRMFIDN